MKVPSQHIMANIIEFGMTLELTDAFSFLKIVQHWTRGIEIMPWENIIFI